MDLVSTQVLDLDICQDVTTAVTGSLIGAEVNLFTNDVVPVRQSVAGDFDAPTYTGNGAEAVTWLAPSIADDGTVEIVGTVGEFRPTDAVTPNDVFGFTIENAGGDLLQAARFENGPLPMRSALNAILLTLRFRFVSGGVGVVVS